MQKINPKEGLLAPSICIVCETVPQRDCIDTGFDTAWGINPDNAGRKYVCDLCIDTMAKLMGYEQDEVIADVRAAKEVADRQVAAIRGLVKDFSEFMAKFVESPAAVNEDVQVEFKSANAPKVKETQAEASETVPEAEASKDGKVTKQKAPKPADKVKKED